MTTTPSAKRVALGRGLAEVYEAFGYRRVEPPILEPADAFLAGSGEELRRRSYVFQDPGGRALCLRPELTIPTCRHYLAGRSADPAGDFAGVARLYYDGAAFRYGGGGERPPELHQVGVECLGARDAEAADAEILGLAVEAVRKAGVAGVRVRVGDATLLDGLIDALPIVPRLRSLLRRGLVRPTALDRAPAGGQTRGFVEAVSGLGPERSTAVVGEVLLLAGIRQVGGRTLEEITARFLDRAAATPGEPLSSALVDRVRAFASIQGPPGACIPEARARAREAGVDLEVPLARLERRLRIAERYELPPSDVLLDLGLRRGPDYYTGLIFELEVPGLPGDPLGGGGRYDRLLGALGATEDIPAVGFAIALDALARASGLQDPRTPIQATVAGAGAVAAEPCAAIAQLLRRAGWRVRLELSGERPRKVLRNAVRDGATYVVFVGEHELRSGSVKVKHLASHEEQEIAIDDLGRYAGGKAAEA